MYLVLIIDLNFIFKYSLSRIDFDFLLKTLFLKEDPNIKNSKEKIKRITLLKIKWNNIFEIDSKLIYKSFNKKYNLFESRLCFKDKAILNNYPSINNIKEWTWFPGIFFEHDY